MADQHLERAATTAFSNVVIGRLVGEIEKQVKLYRGLSSETQDLKGSLIMLAMGMDVELIQHGGAPRTSVAIAYGREMRSLTHDIEDCLERFLHRVTCKEGASRLGRAEHTLRTIPRSMRFARKIKNLKRRLENARNRVFNSPGQSSFPTAMQALTSHADTNSPVGIAETTESIVALLEKTNQHSVITIVGFRGSGKTTLARAVYSISKNQFPCHAWVSFSSLDDQSAVGILTDIQRQLLPGEQFSESNLKEYIDQQKRYLIVLDGAKMEHLQQWDTLRDTFKAGSGGMLVTTSVQSVVNAFTSHCFQENRFTPCGQADSIRSFGYVYSMRPLGKEDSQTLALLGRRAPELLHGATILLEKCDGHPLALASVANQLRCQDEPTGQFCMELGSSLGSYLEWDDSDEPNFTRLRTVIFDIYAGLPDHFVRTCLLYLCIFPANQSLRRNIIIRRWCAEGYAERHRGRELKAADDIFKLLVDRNVFWRAVPSRNAIVKACRIHGILHAFLVHKSTYENFVTFFGEERHGLVRHLVVYHNNKTNLRTPCKLDFSRTRSVTIFGDGEGVISNFLQFKLVRVLDLDECTDLNDNHLDDICKLWNLRYLSLGRNVTTIPKEIVDLKLLETLDVSKTKVDELPLEIIGLPSLIHLIGKFTLQKPLSTDSNKLKLMIAGCKLETLAGIVTDGTSEFLGFMVHMKRLKKVKVWCNCGRNDVNLNNELTRVIPRFLQKPIISGSTRCLSLDFEAVPEGTLYIFEDFSSFCLRGNTIYLSTLKLRGEMSTLPPFIPKLAHLKELCLSLSRVTQDMMAKLCKLNMLLYLKVTAYKMDHFIIPGGAFETLRRLRFVVQGANFILPTIQDGALPQLVSLQLLCRGLVSSGIEIRNLKNLKEVVLDSGVHINTRDKWKDEARRHPNSPHIFMV